MCGTNRQLDGTFTVKAPEFFRTERQVLINLLKSRGLTELNNRNAADIIFTIHKQKVENPYGFEGAYKLSTHGSVNIAASANTGIFYAIQTLRQLLIRKGGKLVLPQCTIRDWPAFQYREYMVDVGRNYQSISQLKEQINVMATYKMNKLHLHLTDDPG